MSTTITANIQIWRQKAAAGTLTIEEMRQAIAAIRQERGVASEVSASSRAVKTTKTRAAKAAPINSDDLLRELDF